MSLREAKKCKIGDKVKLKDTGEIVTVLNVVFVMGGIGYPANAIQFKVSEHPESYYHPSLQLVN